MLEKGIEGPSRQDLMLEDVVKLPKLGAYLREMDRWFQKVSAVLPKIVTYTATIDPASVAANTMAEQTFTVTGLTTQDIVSVNKPSSTSGLGIVGVRVSAANTLAITFYNGTGAPINAGSESYLIAAIRR